MLTKVDSWRRQKHGCFSLKCKEGNSLMRLYLKKPLKVLIRAVMDWLTARSYKTFSSPWPGKTFG
jgi:hypothetical protein